MSDYAALEAKNTEILRYPSGNSLSYAEQDYLKQLKSLKASGVRITIDDNSELPEEQWERIFMLAERGHEGMNQFYMSDYLFGANGEVDEVRLDKITVR